MQHLLFLVLGLSIIFWGSKVILKKISKLFNLVCPYRIHYPAFAYSFIISLLFLLQMIWYRQQGMHVSLLSINFCVISFLKFFGILLFFILVSIIIDELWVRQETKKEFNWLSLIDDCLIAVVSTFFFNGSIRIFGLQNPFSNFAPLDLILVCIIIMIGSAILLELTRRNVPSSEIPEPELPSDEADEIKEAIIGGQKTAFWDIQNPIWMDILMITTSLWLFVFGIASFKTSTFNACLMITFAALPALFFGGIRVLVNNNYLRINLGAINLKMVEIPIYQIQEVSLYKYAPLREFGGYGVRFNGKMSAYYMRGNLGVLVKTTAGKQYLLGSDHPEKLLAVINAVRESKQIGIE